MGGGALMGSVWLSLGLPEDVCPALVVFLSYMNDGWDPYFVFIST